MPRDPHSIPSNRDPLNFLARYFHSGMPVYQARRCCTRRLRQTRHRYHSGWWVSTIFSNFFLLDTHPAMR